MIRFTLSAAFLCIASLMASAQPAGLDLKGKTLSETFTELLPKMAAADNGTREAAQQRWQEICLAIGAPGNERLRAQVCSLMAAQLGPKTPAEARLWLLTQLQRLGRDESVEAVAGVLDDKDDVVREAAVRALANIPSPKATATLAMKLPDMKGKAKVGLLNALGYRGEATAAQAVAKEMAASDEATAVAAARALGRIPGSESLKALTARSAKSKGAVHAAIADATLIHADRLLKAGKTDEAVAIYTALSLPDEPRAVRLAALRGVIQCLGDRAEGGELVYCLLAGDDVGDRAVAAGQIESLSAPALKVLTSGLDTLPVRSRVLVVTAVAARGDRSQLPVAEEAAASDSPEVKRAGVQALGRLGDASTVNLLLDLMSSKDAVAGVAAESLAALSAEGVNERLIAVLEGEKTAARAVALIGILERRQAPGLVPELLKAAAGTDPQIRAAAFNALRSLASPADLPGMLAAFLKTEKGKDRDQAEVAIVAVASQIPQPAKRTEPVLAAIKATREQAAELLPLLGRLGGPEALKVISEALANTNPATHAAAFAAICNWPDTTANEELLLIAERSKADAERLAALRALIRVNTAPGDRTPRERLASLSMMELAMTLATRDDERRAILEGLGQVRVIDTLRYVVPYLDDPTFAQSACKGVVELAHSKMLRDPNKAEFVKALDRVIVLCKDKGLVDRAKQYKTAP